MPFFVPFFFKYLTYEARGLYLQHVLCDFYFYNSTFLKVELRIALPVTKYQSFFCQVLFFCNNATQYWQKMFVHYKVDKTGFIYFCLV